MPQILRPAIVHALPFVWAASAILSLALAWLACHEYAQFSAQRTVFDRKTFLSQASRFPPHAKQLAKLYASEVDSVSRMPPDARARAQEASSFNLRTFEYAADIDNWGSINYWASPLEMIGKGAGDCKDFAFSAYEILSASGAKPHSLRMGYATIQLNGRREAHMVLLSLDGPHAWVVDNTREEVLDLEDRADLHVFFSFDMASIYIGASQQPSGSATARLAKWKDLLDKAYADGFRQH